MQSYMQTQTTRKVTISGIGKHGDTCEHACSHPDTFTAIRKGQAVSLIDGPESDTMQCPNCRAVIICDK